MLPISWRNGFIITSRRPLYTFTTIRSLPVAWLKNVCGRLREKNLSAAEVTDAAGGNLLNFMISGLNRAAEQKTDEEGE